jgi:hypothetical protein
MITFSMINFLAGAALGQRFKVMVLMPAIVIVPGLSVLIGLAHAQSAWSIVLMAAAASTCLQVGYFVGIGVRHVLEASLSRRSTPLASPATSVRHGAR